MPGGTFIDTSVLLYAMGQPHPLKAVCGAVLAAAARGDVVLHASVDAVQEALYYRARRGPRQEAVADARSLSAMVVLHAFDETTAERMIDLVETTSIRGRDAVHAATALQAGFTEIVSTDPDFDDVPGLRRLDPVDLVARLGSAAEEARE